MRTHGFGSSGLPTLDKKRLTFFMDSRPPPRSFNAEEATFQEIPLEVEGLAAFFSLLQC